MGIKYAKGTTQLVGNNSSEWLWGDNDDNDILGNGGNDNIYGGYGDDTLSGGPGNDVIRGADGDDTIRGGTGSDILTGGKHRDDFVFFAEDLGGTDTIRDFKVGEDQLVLEGTVSIGSIISLDTNGDGSADATKLVLTDGTTSSVVLLDGVSGATVASLTMENVLL